MSACHAEDRRFESGRDRTEQKPNKHHVCSVFVFKPLKYKVQLPIFEFGFLG